VTSFVCLQDKAQIEAFLRLDSPFHVYELGDLDEPFWPHTTWYALERSGHVEAVALYFTGTALPVLLALTRQAPEPTAELLRLIADSLPSRFYAHLTPALVPALTVRFGMTSHGTHLKLALRDASRRVASRRVASRLREFDDSAVERLTANDLPELLKFYEIAYPGHWFEPHMLEVGMYFGIRREGALVSVAGTHVVSVRYRVAALGNIATHPDFRGQGLATAATARLGRALSETADCIGLNVHAGNAAAIACYEKLGFVRLAPFEELMLEERQP
jgi:predicted GNAT family acetyltransferase